MNSFRCRLRLGTLAQPLSAIRDYAVKDSLRQGTPAVVLAHQLRCATQFTLPEQVRVELGFTDDAALRGQASAVKPRGQLHVARSMRWPTAAYQTVAVELVVGDAKEFPRDGLDTPVAPVQGGDVVWLATTQQ